MTDNPALTLVLSWWVLALALVVWGMSGRWGDE
jgi:hypothetical protein